MGTGKQLLSVGVLAVVAGTAWAAPQPNVVRNPFADLAGVDDEIVQGPVSPTPIGSPLGDPNGPPGGPGTPVVPLPSAALLGAAGLGVLGGVYRRRSAR